MLDKLRKIRGFNFEDIVAFLQEKNIPHRVRQEPQRSTKHVQLKYFRDSIIHVAQEKFDEISGLAIYESLRKLGKNVGYPYGCVSYREKSIVNIRAFYEIQEDFDVSQLDGSMWFREGLLIERVLVGKGYF